MVKKSIKAQIMLESLIQEIGDLSKISPYPYDLDSKGGKFIVSDLPSNPRGSVNIDLWPQNILPQIKTPPIINKQTNFHNASYSIEGDDTQYAITDISTLFKIIKTVIEIISKHLESHPNITTITISASDKKGSLKTDPQKYRFYELLIKQQLPDGFRVSEGNMNGYKLLILQKTNING